MPEPAPKLSREEVDAQRQQAIHEFVADRKLAHEVLFRHRHTNKSPEFHDEVIALWHSDVERVVTEAFRGGAKSTRAEEVFIIRACLREFRNGLIIGSSYDRACERLHAIKHELDTNEWLAELFGPLHGAVWTENKIVLTNGVCIQAHGRGQSLRGTKHNDVRPDAALLDDLEDDETVANVDARRKTLRWLYRTLLPALAPNAWVRFIGNRLDPDAVIVQVANDPNWRAQRFPIMYQDERGISDPMLPPGKWKSIWADRFPMKKIIELRAEYIRRGILYDFNQEYMCEADVQEEKPFKPEQILVKPRTHIWEATYAMFDPARTVNARSATTGKAVWSWVGNRLIVWDGYAKMLMPDQIVAEVFKTDEDYRPVILAVEEDGLNEFLMQPLRHEQVKRGHALPNLKAEKAPKGKLDFIKALQPFFNAREVEFATELPGECREQLLAYPTGRIDFPNALAYALKLRPGAPLYDEFTQTNVVDNIEVDSRKPVWLALNATGAYTTGVLLQYVDGLRIIADWVEEGDAGAAAPRLLKLAALEASGTPRCVGGPVHFDKYNNVGLKQALGRGVVDLRPGAKPEQGRAEIRALLRRQTRGHPAVMVSHQARWTLNAFAAGYARAMLKGGIIADIAEDNFYRTLMEGLESFAALLKSGVDDDEREDVVYAESGDGRRYISAMARR